mmetsp:Transcript_398/g.441  ORF Transcript_398/g.441 Transcript_398/m.441 type:complete len:114 (-) Transcript_398:99-440(-)
MYQPEIKGRQTTQQQRETRITKSLQKLKNRLQKEIDQKYSSFSLGGSRQIQALDKNSRLSRPGRSSQTSSLDAPLLKSHQDMPYKQDYSSKYLGRGKDLDGSRESTPNPWNLH